ncbi:MAG: hypothetical protein WC357_02875 [Candidatus Omnitrophota bacterium]
MSNHYLAPKIYLTINNRRLFEFPKAVRKNIIELIRKENDQVSERELREALEETRKCISFLTGLFPPKDSSKEAVDKLAKGLFEVLNDSLNDKQKIELRTLIRELLRQDLAFGEEINNRSEKATKKVIRIASPEGSSVGDIKRKLELRTKEPEIKKLFYEKIVGDIYKDPLTLGTRESRTRFERLRCKASALEEELQFFIDNPRSPDVLLLKTKFSNIKQIEELLYHLKLAISAILTPEGKKDLFRKVPKKELEKCLRKLKRETGYTPSTSPTDMSCKNPNTELLLLYPMAKPIKNPAFFNTVNQLADIWKKYTGKQPTRRFNAYSSGEQTHSPFIQYLTSSIASVIPIKSGINIKAQDVSLPNIAKEVIAYRKRMAEISSK